MIATTYSSPRLFLSLDYFPRRTLCNTSPLIYFLCWDSFWGFSVYIIIIGPRWLGKLDLYLHESMLGKRGFAGDGISHAHDWSRLIGLVLHEKGCDP